MCNHGPAHIFCFIVSKKRTVFNRQNAHIVVQDPICNPTRNPSYNPTHNPSYNPSYNLREILLAYFGGSLYYITCVWRGITRHTSESGCSSGGRTLDWGSRGRRFKSCHSDFRRSSVVGTSFFVHTMTGRSVPKHSVIIEVGSIHLIGQRYRTAHLNERSRLLFHNPAQIKKQRKTGNRRPLSLSHACTDFSQSTARSTASRLTSVGMVCSKLTPYQGSFGSILVTAMVSAV